MAGRLDDRTFSPPPRYQLEMVEKHWERWLYSTPLRRCCDQSPLLADILALAVSGIMMSGFVFDWLPISGGMILSRRLHLFASHWGLILMALHTGMHWNMLFSLGGACAKKKTPTVCWSGLQEGWHWLWLCLEFTPSSSKTWRTICSCGQRSCFGMKQNLHGCSLSKFFPSWACLSP